MKEKAAPASQSAGRFGAKSLRRFCQDWDISRPTAYRLAASGRLKLSKIAGATRVTFDDEATFAASLKQAR
jgi:hypothetical protein